MARKLVGSLQVSKFEASFSILSVIHYTYIPQGLGTVRLDRTTMLDSSRQDPRYIPQRSCTNEYF
jgi:hypothetical protein